MVFLLLLLYLNRTAMDGESCHRRIQESERWHHMPILIYSSSGNSDDEIKTELSVAAHFIKKPLHFKEEMHGEIRTIGRHTLGI